MKNLYKRLGSFLLCLAMVFSLLPPYSAAAEDMVYIIEDEEDFYAIMDNPSASYRLEADLDLGTLAAPIGGVPENHTGYWFSGSLDGNGHSIRYSMREIEGWNEYGLFFGLDNAEITNLTLYADIQLHMPEGHQYYSVSPLSAYGYDATVTNVTVDGSITVTGGSASADMDLYSLTANSTAANCRADVDIDVRMTPDTRIEYWGLNGAQAYFCELYGDVHMEGHIARMYQLYRAQDCVASQNLELYPSYIDFKPDHQGSFNYLENTLTVQPYPGKTEVSGWMQLLNETKGSYYTGSVALSDCAVTFSGAYKCEGVEVACDITATNWGTQWTSLIGLSYSTDSVFRGDVFRYGGEASYEGLQNCQRCLYVGDITQEATAGGHTSFANQSSDCVVEGDIYTHSTEGYTGSSAYGLNYCQRSSFTGNLHAVSDTSYASVNGASSNCVSCIVIGDLTAEGADGSSAILAGDDSYYEGTVRAGRVTGIGSGSSAKADIYAKEEVRLITGSNSYFSGNISMNDEETYLTVFQGKNNVANVNVSMNAWGKWFLGNWDSGPATTAQFSSEGYEGNNSFSGSVSIRANGGVSVDSAFPVTVSHSKVGTWNTGGIAGVWRHIDGLCSYNCPGSVVTSLENLSYSQANHYRAVVYVNSSTPNVSAGDASAGWDGSIDAEGRYEPERENADYGIQLTDMLDRPIPGAKLILGGASYITDEGGCVYIENGPGVISPLEVQLKNADGEYETVLTRQACYPIPNRTNVIRLEPVVDLDVTFLASENASEDGGTASGGQLDIGGRQVPVLAFPLNVDIEGSLGNNLKFTTKYDPRENKMYVAIGSGYEGTKHSKFDDARYNQLVEDLAHGDFDSWQEASRVLQDAESVKAGVGFGSWETKFMGYVEMQFGDDWKITDSGFLVGGKGELRAVYPYLVPGVYGTVGLLGEAETKGNLVPLADGLFNDVAYRSTANLDLKARVECAIGAGIRSARLYAEVGVGGELSGQLTYPWESTQKSLKLDALLDAFGEVNCMIFSHRITFMKKTFPLWPQQTAANVLSRAIAQGGNFQIAPRNYAQGAVMQTMAADTQAASYLGLNSQSSYPYAEVSLLKLSNGKYLLVYTDDDLSRGSADRSTLRACLGRAVDGNLVWGEAVTIENDGTGDYGFAVTTDGYSVAILWQDSNTSFGDGDGITPEDMAKTVTLSQTILDCSGEIPAVGEISTVAEAGSMPYFPTVYYDGSNTCAAWVTSSNPDPSVYLADESETLWLSGSFGAAGEAVAADQTSVSGIALGGTELYWTTGTESDVTLWKRSSDGNISQLDTGNIRSLQSSGENLCYAKDDMLYYGSAGSEPRQQDQGSGYDNILRLSADGRVYAAQLGTESSRICEIQEGKALPIGEYPGYLSSWDVCDGYIVTLVRSGFEETDTAAFSAEASQQIEASRLNDLVCENPEAPSGSYVSYNADIFNDGYNEIETLPVTVTAADGTVLLNESVTCSIQPGESGEVSFGFTVPEGFTAQDVTVTVGEHTQTESLGGSNLKAEARWSQAKADGITVKISNTGLGASSGTVTVTDGSKTLYTGEVTVEEGQTESIWVPFEEIYDEAAQFTVTLTEDSGAMHSYDNEATVSVTPLKLRALRCGDLTLEPGESAELQVTPWPMGATMTNLGFRSEDSSIVTVDEQGRVTAVSPGEGKITVTTLEGVRTEVTVTVPGEPIPTDPTEPSDPTTPSEPTGPSNPGNPTAPSDPTTPTAPTEPEDPAKPTEPAYENPFVDVADTEYFYTPVLWAVQKGITNGLDATHFGPGEGCTRAHVVTFLWRAAGSPAPKSQANPFTDVQPGAYYYDAVLWAVEQGVTNGTSATTFAPDATCTRGQIVTFLWRYRGSPAAVGGGSFRDVAADQYYSTAVTWAVAENITNGMGDGLFAPDATCTRGQIVTFLYRAMAE